MSRPREYAAPGTSAALSGWTIPAPGRIAEGDVWQIRVWFRANRAESESAREVHGRVVAVDHPPEGGCRVTFRDPDGGTWRLSRGTGDGVLRKRADRSGAYRRMSARWGGVLGISSDEGWASRPRRGRRRVGSVVHSATTRATSRTTATSSGRQRRERRRRDADRRRGVHRWVRRGLRARRQWVGAPTVRPEGRMSSRTSRDPWRFRCPECGSVALSWCHTAGRYRCPKGHMVAPNERVDAKAAG